MQSGIDWFNARPYQLILTEEDVKGIKRLLHLSSHSIRVIADLYGVSHAMVWKIKQNKSWKHVQIDEFVSG